MQRHLANSTGTPIMMIKKFLSLAALTVATTAAMVGSNAAWALQFEGAATFGDTVVTSYHDTSLISFDVDFANASPVILGFTVEASDLLQPISLNAIVRNLTGTGINAYTLAIDGATFGTIGSVTRQFSGNTLVTQPTSQMAQLYFDSPEFLDIEIGDALGSTAGALNWTLRDVQAGERLHVIVAVGAVPEPGSYALLLSGLAMASLALKRRSPQSQARRPR